MSQSTIALDPLGRLSLTSLATIEFCRVDFDQMHENPYDLED